MDPLEVILRALWLMIPMLVPNSAAVFFGGGTPIDFGRKMKDGRRILGDGKTWRGLIGGTASGIVIGLIQYDIVLRLEAPEWWYGDSLQTVIFILFLLAFGSMLGDILGSFIKRRMKKKRGARFPVMDQYDFFVGTLILMIPLQFDWFYENFIENEYILGLIGLIIIIPILHMTVNIIGYKMGKKDVPW